MYVEFRTSQETQRALIIKTSRRALYWVMYFVDKVQNF